MLKEGCSQREALAKNWVPTARYIRMLDNWKDHGFLVEVVCCRHAMTAGDNAKGSVLNRLKLPSDDAGPDNQTPDWRSIGVY
jgi:hypothetical protein